MSPENNLQGKTALITGASSGIGRETAHTLAERGANVVLAARRIDRLERLAETIETDHGVDALPIETDVTDYRAVEELLETTVETFETLDIVVSNAGSGTEPGVAIEDMAIEQYWTVTDVNIDGMFFTARASLPHLRESSGTLVFLGSFAGKYPRPWSPVYAATKWWTRGFALSLAGQVGDDDVAVTVVNPSEVRTEFGREFREEDQLHTQQYEPSEVTEPAEVAAAIAYAVTQDPPNAVTELDLYRRDKFEGF